MKKRGFKRLNILGVFCNPKGTSKLALMKEQRDILERVALSKHREHIQFDSCPAATVDDLGHQLLQKTYQVVHFSGHGDTDSSLLHYVCDQYMSSQGVDLRTVPANIARIRSAVQNAKMALANQNSTELVVRGSSMGGDGQTGAVPFRMTLDRAKVAELGMSALAFEGANGEMVLPPPAALVQLICSNNRPKVDCVVLNACDTFTLGQLLIEQGVKYVICTHGRISDEAASAYTIGFYDSLCAGLSYTQSHNEAMIRVKSKGVDIAVHGAPTLLVNDMAVSAAEQQSALGAKAAAAGGWMSSTLSSLLEVTPTISLTARAIQRFTYAMGYSCDAADLMAADGKGRSLGDVVVGPPMAAVMPMTKLNHAAAAAAAAKKI